MNKFNTLKYTLLSLSFCLFATINAVSFESFYAEWLSSGSCGGFNSRNVHDFNSFLTEFKACGSAASNTSSFSWKNVK